MRTLSEKSARAGHWAVSLHRGCVLVLVPCTTVLEQLEYVKRVCCFQVGCVIRRRRYAEEEVADHVLSPGDYSGRKNLIDSDEIHMFLFYSGFILN